MTEYINHGSLKVSKELDDLINKKVCVGIDLEPENFWVSFERIIEEFTPRNRALLDKREVLQKKLMTGTWPIKVSRLIKLSTKIS